MKPTASFLVFLALAPTCSHAAAPDPALSGCWRAGKIVQRFQDGSKAEDTSGRCTLRFTEDKLESTCATASSSVTSTYSLRIARANFYLATMTGSTFRTGLIGSVREYEYHVNGDRLSLATDLHTAAAAAATVPIRVETEAARVPCP